MPPQTVSELVPDQLWVQCENPDCLKWRKVPGDVTAEELPDKVGVLSCCSGAKWYFMQDGKGFYMEWWKVRVFKVSGLLEITFDGKP